MVVVRQLDKLHSHVPRGVGEGGGEGEAAAWGRGRRQCSSRRRRPCASACKSPPILSSLGYVLTSNDAAAAATLC